MKNWVLWLAGALLVASFVEPHLHAPAQPAPTAPVVTDPTVVRILQNAESADKQHVHDLYAALKVVLDRDVQKSPARLTTTEQWRELHARTLQLAVDKPGKYADLDKAIEAVVFAQLGTLDPVTITPEVSKKLTTACEIVAASALAK